MDFRSELYRPVVGGVNVWRWWPLDRAGIGLRARAEWGLGVDARQKEKPTAFLGVSRVSAIAKRKPPCHVGKGAGAPMVRLKWVCGLCGVLLSATQPARASE